jgi:hypothetical protein
LVKVADHPLLDVRQQEFLHFPLYVRFTYPPVFALIAEKFGSLLVALVDWFNGMECIS